MKIKYFKDTDTALVEFTDAEVEQTRELSENIYVDLDKDGNIVSMTIEHGRTSAQLPDISFRQFDSESRKLAPASTVSEEKADYGKKKQDEDGA